MSVLCSEYMLIRRGDLIQRKLSFSRKTLSAFLPPYVEDIRIFRGVKGFSCPAGLRPAAAGADGSPLYRPLGCHKQQEKNRPQQPAPFFFLQEGGATLTWEPLGESAN